MTRSHVNSEREPSATAGLISQFFETQVPRPKKVFELSVLEMYSN